MVQKEVILNNPTGLHARPANLLVREAQKWNSDIKIKKEDNLYDSKSIINILTMGAVQGDTLTLIADGNDEVDALNNLLEFFNNNFNEWVERRKNSLLFARTS